MTAYKDDDGIVWEPSAWVRDMLATLARRANGRMRTCPHPGAVHRLAWYPSRLLCSGCFLERDPGLTGSPERWRCDRCEANTPDYCKPYLLPVVSKQGLLAAHFGLCRDCSKKEGM